MANPARTRSRRIPSLIGVSMTLAAAVVFAGCSSGEIPPSSGETPAQPVEKTGFADMEPVVLKVATLYGPENYSTQVLEDYTDAVTEATEGKVTFEYFYAGSLLPQNEIASGLGDGLVDLAVLMQVYTPADFPIDNWISKAGFLHDTGPIIGPMQGQAALLDWAFSSDEYMAEIESHNLTPIIPRFLAVYSYDLICKDPVSSLADAAGKRMRVGGEAWAQEAENIGGVPVTVPSADAYSAFQQGVVDCHMGGMGEINALGLTDHGKNYTSGGFTGWTSIMVSMNTDSWDALPLIAQQAMWDQIPVYIESGLIRTAEANLDFVGNAATAGVNFITPARDFTDAVAKHHQNVLTELPNNAPTAITNANATLSAFVDAHAEWLDKVTALGYPSDWASWAEYYKAGAPAQDYAEYLDLLTEEVLSKHRPK